MDPGAKKGKSSGGSNKMPSFKERLAMGFGGGVSGRGGKPPVTSSSSGAAQKKKDTTAESAAPVQAQRLQAPSGPVLTRFLFEAQYKQSLFAKSDEVKKDALKTWLESNGAKNPDKAIDILLKENFIEKSEQLGYFRPIEADLTGIAVVRPVFDFFADRFLANNGAIMRYLLQGSSSESMYQGLVNCFSETELMTVLMDMISDRIVRTNIESDLFRMDEPDITLLGWISRHSTQFHAFVKTLFKETLDHILAVPAAFEVDPQYLVFPLMQEGNLVNLRRLMEKFLSTIEEYSNRDPMEMRQQVNVPAFVLHLGQHVFRAVEKKFPGGGSTAFSTLLILRGISPAICFPERFNLIKYEPSQIQRRTLITFARLMQQIFNGQLFNPNHMLSSFNDLITARRSVLSKFIVQFISLESGSGTSRNKKDKEIPDLSTLRPSRTKYDFVNIMEGVGAASNTIQKRMNATNAEAVEKFAELSEVSDETAVLRFVHRCAYAVKEQNAITSARSESEMVEAHPEDEDTAIKHVVMARTAAQKLKEEGADTEDLQKHLEALAHLIVMLQQSGIDDDSVSMSRSEVSTSHRSESRRR